MTEQKPDLFEAGVLEEKTEDEVIASAVQGINDSLAAIHIGMRTLANRVLTLEKMVGYLLEKDPEMGPKMRAQAEKLAAEAQAVAENGPTE